MLQRSGPKLLQGLFGKLLGQAAARPRWHLWVSHFDAGTALCSNEDAGAAVKDDDAHCKGKDEYELDDDELLALAATQMDGE